MTDQVAVEATEPTEQDPVLARVQEHFGDRLIELGLDGDCPAFVIDREGLIELVTFLKDEPDLGFDRLSDLCAVDYLELERTPRFGIVYHLYAAAQHRYARIRVPVDEDDAVVPSLTAVWPGANWFEREAFDQYGIEFSDHPDLKRILNPDDWEGYPLRKDYEHTPEAVEFSFNPEKWQKAVQRGD
ncbi:MAG TPA: NADH-quinone oxidoreductase subunit C [Chloroflexota bacterium]|nr:NADH-quinone oxidoreductase subunit C [Chloroflexota bacterium]